MTIGTTKSGRVCACIRVCVCARARVCMCACAFVLVRVHLCLCLCVCVCILELHDDRYDQFREASAVGRGSGKEHQVFE